jgi:predicted  nucleic acid-binding Zn-ribbon protein
MGEHHVHVHGGDYGRIERLLEILIGKVEHMTQEVDDLKQAVVDLKAAVAEASADLQDLANKVAGATSLADLPAITSDIRATAQALKNAAETADPPPAPPTT